MATGHEDLNKVKEISDDIDRAAKLLAGAAQKLVDMPALRYKQGWMNATLGRLEHLGALIEIERRHISGMGFARLSEQEKIPG